jgi:hypothetical protein
MKSILHFSLAFIILFAGCKKGKDGTDGKDGNANVKYRTFNSPGWNDNGSYWYTDLGVPEITSDNLNSAAVQVFIGTGTDWTAIPCAYVTSTNYFWTFIMSTGSVRVKWTYNGIGSGSSPNSIYNATVQVKVVVIPPALIKPGINYRNYDELRKAYNIQE